MNTHKIQWESVLVCLFSMNTSTQFLPIFIGLCIWQGEHTVNMLKQQRNYECHHTIKAITSNILNLTNVR